MAARRNKTVKPVTPARIPCEEVEQRVNQHGLERLVRIGLGARLLYKAYACNRLEGLLGALPLITGLTGSCPVYRAMRVSTNPYPHLTARSAIGEAYIGWLRRTLVRAEAIWQDLLREMDLISEDFLAESQQFRDRLLHELRQIKAQLVDTGELALNQLLAEGEHLTDELLAEAEQVKDQLLDRVSRLEELLDTQSCPPRPRKAKSRTTARKPRAARKPREEAAS